MTSTLELANKLSTDMTLWRHHLHQHPEFGFEEVATGGFIVARLREFGVSEVATGVGGTGVVATVRKGTSNKAIGIRADMDALRIDEAGTPSYRSTTPGVMHACGHDGHTTILLGLAKLLNENIIFDGVIHLIFQPAEEWGKGMLAMLDDGLLDRFPIEEAYGLHNMPGFPVGEFATRSGAIMAAEDNFAIQISGKGGHASRPQDHADALVAACAVVMALQTIVSRHIDPAQLSVLSVTEMQTDGTRNAVAGSATITGDTRSFDPAVSLQIESGMRRVVEGTAAAHGCTATVDYTREFVPLINDDELTQSAILAAKAAAYTPENVNANYDRIGASEDFAQLLQHVPGNFMFLGNGDSASLHNPSYDFNDAALPHGVAYFAELVKARLPVQLAS